MRISILSAWLCMIAAAFTTIPADAGSAATAPVPASATATAGTVTVVARNYLFLTPNTIPSGWVRFHFENQGTETHFFSLHLLPEGVTMQDYQKEVVPPFGVAWEGLRHGTMTQAEAGKYLAEHLPKWWPKLKDMGGGGLLAPGRSQRFTIKLVPGTYLMECYEKTPEGVFHADLGMLSKLTVTEQRSNVEPPRADYEITLSSAGIATKGKMTPGEHTIAVQFKEQPQGVAGVGYDVHLARLDKGQSVDQLVPWMNWMNVKGLQSPAPATFLGGLQEMPAGYTGYFTVDVTPGRYAWISEMGAD